MRMLAAYSLRPGSDPIQVHPVEGSVGYSELLTCPLLFLLSLILPYQMI